MTLGSISLSGSPSSAAVIGGLGVAVDSAHAAASKVRDKPRSVDRWDTSFTAARNTAIRPHFQVERPFSRAASWQAREVNAMKLHRENTSPALLKHEGKDESFFASNPLRWMESAPCGQRMAQLSVLIMIAGGMVQRFRHASPPLAAGIRG